MSNRFIVPKTLHNCIAYMTVLLQKQKFQFSLHCVCKMVNYGRVSSALLNILHTLYMILIIMYNVCNVYSTGHSVMAKNHIWHSLRLTKIANLATTVCAKNGQKTCLAWFYTYIRGFNRFLVPTNIRIKKRYPTWLYWPKTKQKL